MVRFIYIYTAHFICINCAMIEQKLIARSKEVMRRVEEEIGQSIGLFGLNRETMVGVVLAAVDGTSGFAFHMDVNLEFPLHTSAPGKIFIAYTPPELRKEIYAKMDFRAYTPNSITNLDDFEAELESVLGKGYALDISEEREGSHCIGVPIFDASHTILSSLWTSGPSSQFPLRIIPKVAEVLKKGAQEITQRLSGSGRVSSRETVHSVVEQAKQILDDNLHQTVDVQEIAANLYVSYAWFRRVFKEQTGEAPTEYHQKRRLEKARQLLRDSDKPIKQISETLGFKNQNHFSALFKRKTGQSPSVFRNIPEDRT